MRIERLAILGLVLLAGCMPVLHAPAPSAGTGSVSQTGDNLDLTNEGMPTTTDSLETATVTGAQLDIHAISGGTILIGDLTAPRLTMYTDYGCEYCREFALSLRPWIEQEYVATKSLSIELAFVPMTPAGTYMASAAICAEKQHKFPDADHALSLSTVTNDAQLVTFAKQLSLNLFNLRTCMKAKETAATLAAMKARASAAGVSRLPTFELEDKEWIGVPEQDALRKTIEQALHL